MQRSAERAITHCTPLIITSVDKLEICNQQLIYYRASIFYVASCDHGRHVTVHAAAKVLPIIVMRQ